MSDFLERLKDVAAEGLPVNPLSAPEVRRRGDRMRRRRHVFQAVGAAAAVAVIASGGFLVSHDVTSAPQHGPATQQPTPAPSATVTSEPSPKQEPVATEEIPEDFPIGAGLGPRPSRQTGVVTRVDAPDQEWQVVSCSKGGVPGDQNRTAARGLEVTGDFFGRRRQVVVYRDVASADAALTGLITRLDACAAGQGDAGAQPMGWTSDALPGLGTPGETGWRAMTGSSTADGSHPFYVELFATRVGRAVVVSGRGQNDPFAAADSLKDSHGRVVEAMCRYTDDNCASVDRDLGTDPLRDLYVPREGEQQTRHVTEIPDHIDLSEGLAADDVETVRASSIRLDEPWFYDPCHAQGRARDEGRSDFRSEAASGPEHSEFRQLAIYPSADAAEKVLASWFVGSLLDCDIYRYDDRTSEDHWDALDQGWVPADEAFVYVSESWSDGTRTTRATVYVIARLGNAILVVGEDGELGATDTSVQATVQDLKPYVTDVLTQQLCGFADGGSC